MPEAESHPPADPAPAEPTVEPDATVVVAAGDVQAAVKRRINPLLELLIVLAAAFALWYVVNGWIVKPYRIPTASMEPTLQAGDRVLVARFEYRLHDPNRGDVVVFHPPGSGDVPRRGATTQASVYFIKRIVGLPGETIQARSGRVDICRAPGRGCRVLDEPYLKQQGVVPDFGPIVIPRGEYFMMGDNRADSDDSRDWGFLPRRNIIGEAFATYWPPGRLRTL